MTTYRVFVSTDLGGDPDDIQSLYRLIHYSDILNVEGIGSCTGPGSTPKADRIREWIRRVDVDHLRERGHTDLMTEADLLACVKQGLTTPGRSEPERQTEASTSLIERAHAGSTQAPLWVLVWGSLTDVAQALHEDPRIAPKIRINSIGSSNTVNDPESRDYVYRFMARHYKDLWWIENGMMPKLSHDTFRGVYQGGDQSGEWDNIAFIHQNIRGHGSTHNGLFSDLCGNVFPVAGWPNGTLKEGDSPTMLHLLSPVLGGTGDVDDPTRESWGGQYRQPDPGQFPNYYTDLDADAETCQATIARWRTAFLAHWKARWDRYETHL